MFYMNCVRKGVLVIGIWLCCFGTNSLVVRMGSAMILSSFLIPSLIRFILSRRAGTTLTGFAKKHLWFRNI